MLKVKERLAPLLCALAVTAGSVASSNTPVSAGTIIMKMGIATVNDQQHEWLKRYKTAVERDSKGRIEVQIYPASQLGSIPRMIEDTQFGSIQGYAGPAEFFAGVDPRYQVLGAPALFESPEQAQRTLEDPELNVPFLALGESKGLKGIGLYYYADNGVNTRRPVRDVADLKGMKIRDYGGAMQEALMKSLGVTGVPMPLDQVMPALQQGAIDGTVSGITTTTALKYYDTAKYFAPINMSILAVVVVVSKEWYQGLPADLQRIVAADGRTVSHDIFPYTVAFIKSSNAAWVAAGGVMADFTPAQLRTVHDLESHVAGDVLSDKPQVKQLYDVVVKVAHKYR
jgi:TRAP-type C4-dicarboxylate transport system substrate-binding protein